MQVQLSHASSLHSHAIYGRNRMRHLFNGSIVAFFTNLLIMSYSEQALCMQDNDVCFSAVGRLSTWIEVSDLVVFSSVAAGLEKVILAEILGLDSEKRTPVHQQRS